MNIKILLLGSAVALAAIASVHAAEIGVDIGSSKLACTPTEAADIIASAPVDTTLIITAEAPGPKMGPQLAEAGGRLGKPIIHPEGGGKV